MDLASESQALLQYHRGVFGKTLRDCWGWGKKSPQTQHTTYCNIQYKRQLSCCSTEKQQWTTNSQILICCLYSEKWSLDEN